MALSSHEHQRIAQRYAAPLYAIAQEQNAVDTVREEIAQFSQLARDNEELSFVCHSPVISDAQKKQAIAAVADSAQCHALTKQFLVQLAENGRLAVLGTMDEALAIHIAAKHGDVPVEIVSAHALSGKQSEALQEAVGKALDRSVHPVWSVDDSLIGGVKIRIGSRELDASVKGTLARSRTRLYDTIQQT